MSTRCKKEVKEIEIECKIPADLPNFTCIKYPAKIENVENALESLGGHQTIQQTFTKFNQFKQHNATKSKTKNKKSSTTNSQPEPYLELHLNPNGVFDHPLFGKIRPVKNCILIKKTTKIPKQKSRKRKFNEMHREEIESKTSIEVMGRITSVVTYDELCDFQVFSELKYPQKASNHQPDTVCGSNSYKIRKRNKRQRVWSLREDDIPNISKYPLVPRVFASKAMPYDGFLKESQKPKTSKTSKQSPLETQPTEIRFIKKQVPPAPKKGSIWAKYIKDLKEYTSNIKNRKIPNHKECEKKDRKHTQKTKYSFCQKIRNELILQIKSYFEIRPIWTKAEVLVQKFYIYWYHIKYFADRIEGSQNDKGNESVSETDVFYDYDIASIIFERKQKKQFYLNRATKTQPHKPSVAKDVDFELNNSEKIYLDFKEKEKIIAKFLGVVGYKFKNGPFRNSYIKFGFDPRDKLNKNIARPLQLIDYRINKTNGKKLGIDATWNITGSRVGSRGKPNTQKAGKYPMLHTMENIMNNQQINMEAKCIQNETFLNDEDNVKLEKEIMDRIQFKIKPDKLQMYYQLSNIEIIEIQNIINNADARSYNEQCAKDCGWILKKDEAKIRDIMTQKLEIWIAEEIKKKKPKKNERKKKKKKKKEKIVSESSEAIMTMSPTKQTSEDSTATLNINENTDEKMSELDAIYPPHQLMNQLYDEHDIMLFDNVDDEDQEDVFQLL